MQRNKFRNIKFIAILLCDSSRNFKCQCYIRQIYLKAIMYCSTVFQYLFIVMYVLLLSYYFAEG